MHAPCSVQLRRVARLTIPGRWWALWGHRWIPMSALVTGGVVEAMAASALLNLPRQPMSPVIGSAETV